MYSGTDNVDYPTQWALNPSTYQNMANDQVDWGALAQQWIQMKETCPPTTVPPAPPAPVISVPVGEEGGEAPMDVEGNDVEAPAPPLLSSQQWRSGSSNWGNSWDQWGGNGQGNWDWETNSNSKTSQNTVDPPPYTSGYSTSSANYSGFNNSGQQNYRPGYWSTDENNDNPVSNVHNTESSSSRGSRRLQRHHAPSPPHVSVSNIDTTQTIDAAKRRQLPGWIREGLEKMEREKQKQVDREREKKEREEYLKQKKISDELLSQENKQDNVPKPPAKSKFETDSDDSDQEQDKKKTQKSAPPSRERSAVPPPLLMRTPEEIMQDTMLIVRRTLTEILLEVTNEQIMSICQEELSRKRLQPQASRGTSVASKTQALSSIGGQLGLGIYGDSSGESDTEADSEDGRRSGTPTEKRKKMSDMTDGQLQESIRRRKAEFEKTTREIEAQLLNDENNSSRGHRNDVSSSVNDEKSHRHTGERFHNAGSDGEESTTNIRNEGIVNKQRKYSTERTPPLDGTKKATYAPDSHKKQSKKSKHSVREKSRRDGPNDDKSEKGDGKKKSSKSRGHSSSRSSSESSNSGSDSHKKRSDNSNDKRSNSSSRSASSSSASNSSYTSESSRSNKKRSKKLKKSSSSEDSLISKKSKNDRRSDKYKERKGKYDKSGNSNSYDTDKKYDYEYRSRETRRDSHSKSHTGTPERRSAYKSKYSERSRSRSYDRQSNHVYDNHSKYYSTSSRHRSRERRDRSRDRHVRSKERWDDKNEKTDRSRDDRNRMKEGERSKDGGSRDDRDLYKENRNRSRERRDKSSERRDRDRDRRKDREYKDNRSNRY